MMGQAFSEKNWSQAWSRKETRVTGTAGAWVTTKGRMMVAGDWDEMYFIEDVDLSNMFLLDSNNHCTIGEIRFVERN